MFLLLLLGIFAVWVLWEFYYHRVWRKAVDVRLWFDTDARYAGGQTKLYEVIENRKRMPLPVLEVGFHTKKELDFADTENTSVSDYIYKRDVFSVLGMQRITREIAVNCQKRGHYAVSDADLATHTLLYRKRYSIDIETDASIYVYAKMTDVSEIMTVCERMLGTLQCAKRLYEDPFAFRTIRGYTTDDPMKTINWKASAKTGTLMVNTFDSVQSQKAMIFLDVADTGILKQESLVEEGIAVAATLLRTLFHQNIETGFAFNSAGGGEWLLPTNRKSRLIELERTLADYDAAGGTSPFLDLIADGKKMREGLTDDTLRIVITKNYDETLWRALQETAKDSAVLVICPVYRGERQFAEEKAASSSTVRVHIREVERV